MDSTTLVTAGDKINVDTCGMYVHIEITPEGSDKMTSIALNRCQAQIIALALQDLLEQVE